MLLIIVRVLFAIVCTGAILTYVSTGPEALIPGDLPPGLIGTNRFWSFIVLMVASQFFVLLDVLIPKKRIEVVSAIYFGLLVGALLSYLFVLALAPVMTNWQYREVVVLLTTLTFPYLTISLLLQTKDDFRFVIPYVEFSRELKGGRPLVIDSSSLIDGRIADVVDTKILDAPMVVPQFVLHEIQEIADSSDKSRRTRGRRGLEVLAKLQNSPNAEIRMHETDSDEFKGMAVDHRLVALAKKLGGRVMTNDFNLSKVASVQGIESINLNDVANALKPRYLPGERLRIKVIKEGESQSQGVGYLDDGTMVVCEQASHLVGKEIDLIVTSVLQSPSGKMIFTKLPEGGDAG